jgi:hypothetical protein
MTRSFVQRALPLDVSEFASMMHKLSLKVSQRMAYKTTTKRKHSDDLLDQNFNPVIPSQMMISLQRYFNLERLYLVNGCMSLTNHENFLEKVFVWG